MDFAIGLVNSVLNFSAQLASEAFLGNSNYRRTVIIAAHQKFFGATLKTLGLVHTSNNLPEWQVVKPTFLCTLLC